MEKYRVAFVIAESGGKFPYAEIVTTDFVYLRFHGPNAQMLYAAKYSRAQLQHCARLGKQWLAEGRDVWAFFNNDIGGHAFRNARELKEMVE